MTPRRRSGRRVPLGRVYPKALGNVPDPRPEDVIDFYYPFFAANPDLLDPIRDQVDHEIGSPRLITVESLFCMGAAAGLAGTMHTRKINRTALALHPSTQHRLGIVKRKNGKKYKTTERRVEYLSDNINAVYTGGRTLSYADGTLFDTATGEAVTEADLPHGTIETLGNRILGRLWDYVGLPIPDRYALDSEVAASHFAPQSSGAFADIDPTWVTTETRRYVNGSAGHRRRLAEQHAVWRAATAEAAAAILPPATNAEREARARVRKPAPLGPTVRGDFVRFNRNFPQAGVQGRLLHTKDPGAGASFKGAGSSRSFEIVDGRDKHTLVASGHFPNGDHYPPLLRAYACVFGGSSRTAAGLRALKYAADNNITPDNRYVSLDRAYTAPDAPNFQTPAGDLGWNLIQSLSRNQRRCQTWETGVLHLDGWWFSSALPERLRDLPQRTRDTTAEEASALQDLYDERRTWAFRRTGTTDAGSLRLIGPAVPRRKIRNRAGQIVRVTGAIMRCPNSPHFNATDDRIPLTSCLPDEPCGCNKRITIPIADMPSGTEPLLFGTRAWAAEYGRRNLVESFNSVEEYTYAINRHSIQVRADKWDFNHLLLALTTWYRQMRTWLYRQGAHAVDPDEFPGGPLNLDVIAAIIERVMTPNPNMPGNGTPTGDNEDEPDYLDNPESPDGTDCRDGPDG